MRDDLRRAFSESLKQLLDRHGVPASHHGRVNVFAELINRPISTAHRWLTGNGIPPIEDLIPLCDIFACSLDEILGRIPIKRETIDLDQPTRAIYFSENGNVDIDIPTSFLTSEHSAQSLGVLRVAGPEMSGYVEVNDRVFIDLSATTIRSGAVYVLKIADHFAVRRLRIRVDMQVDILCTNNRYPAETVDPAKLQPVATACSTDIAVVGQVIAKLNLER